MSSGDKPKNYYPPPRRGDRDEHTGGGGRHTGGHHTGGHHTGGHHIGGHHTGGPDDRDNYSPMRLYGPPSERAGPSPYIDADAYDEDERDLEAKVADPDAYGEALREENGGHWHDAISRRLGFVEDDSEDEAERAETPRRSKTLPLPVPPVLMEDMHAIEFTCVVPPRRLSDAISSAAGDGQLSTEVNFGVILSAIAAKHGGEARSLAFKHVSVVQTTGTGLPEGVGFLADLRTVDASGRSKSLLESLAPVFVLGVEPSPDLGNVTGRALLLGGQTQRFPSQHHPHPHHVGRRMDMRERVSANIPYSMLREQVDRARDPQNPAFARLPMPDRMAVSARRDHLAGVLASERLDEIRAHHRAATGSQLTVEEMLPTGGAACVNVPVASFDAVVGAAFAAASTGARLVRADGSARVSFSLTPATDDGWQGVSGDHSPGMAKSVRDPMVRASVTFRAVVAAVRY